MKGYKHSEVCKIVNIEPHILRYWEQYLPSLQPVKNSSGQRIYRDSDIELLLHFRYLIYNKLYTVRGALHALTEHNSADTSEVIREIRNARRHLFKALRHISNITRMTDTLKEHKEK